MILTRVEILKLETDSIVNFIDLVYAKFAQMPASVGPRSYLYPKNSTTLDRKSINHLWDRRHTARNHPATE